MLLYTPWHIYGKLVVKVAEETAYTLTSSSNDVDNNLHIAVEEHPSAELSR